MQAHGNWSKAQGQLEEFAKDPPCVADAEEALEDAQLKLEQYEQLDTTIAKTIEFLEEAQQRIHRDIAPVLVDTVLRWLPTVTGGRYTKCRIDPETLRVEVAGPDGLWRRARHLSHGTTEQIYLLLRLALCQHLTTSEEVCPLVLDDVLASTDADRKTVVLKTLLEISAVTQVILFTHELDVRDWAARNLSGPDHRFVELSSPQ